MHPLLQGVGSHRLRRVSLGTITALVVAGVVLATAGLAYVTYAGGQHRSRTNQLVEREIVVAGLYEDVRSAAAAEGATVGASFAVPIPQLLADFDRVWGDGGVGAFPAPLGCPGGGLGGAGAHRTVGGDGRSGGERVRRGP